METINEGSSASLAVELTDKTGALSVPATLRYAIRCMSNNGQVVRGITTLSPAASVDIGLTASDTAIIDPTKAFEVKRITVEALYGDDDACCAEFDFRVRNLTGIP